MLTKLRIKNFKSWENLDIEFAPITGLFGTNSSGKSSVLQFLLMLKETKNAKDDKSLVLDFGGINRPINLGTFKDVIYKHDDKLALEWLVEWTLPKQLTISNPEESSKSKLFEGNTISLKTAAQIRGRRLATNYLSYGFSDQEFKISRRNEEDSEFVLENIGENSSFRFSRTKPGRAWDLPAPVQSFAFPDQVKTYFKNTGFLSEFEYEYVSFMDNIFYLGPLRDFPKREYIWAGSKPNDVGHNGARFVDALLAAKAGDEQRNLGGRTHYKPFEAIIAHWLKEIGLISSFTIHEIAEGKNLHEVRVRVKPDSDDVLITDVGFGVSQVLPVLVLLYYVPEGSIVLLEQPEIHLHPAIQSGLADVIISVVKSRKVQVIVESHSEHLLRRLQRRIAEEKISPNDTKLYFCSIEKGKSKLDQLKIDLFGIIQNWPENFFGDTFGEVAVIQAEGLKRKIEAKKKK